MIQITFHVFIKSAWWVVSWREVISYFSPMKTHLFLLYCPIPPFSLRISSSMMDRSEQSQASHLHFPDSISVPVSYRDIMGGWIRKVFLFSFMFVSGPPSKSRRPPRTKSKDVPFVTTSLRPPLLLLGSPTRPTTRTNTSTKTASPPYKVTTKVEELSRLDICQTKGAIRNKSQ